VTGQAARTEELAVVDQVLADLASTRLRFKTPSQKGRMRGLIRQRLTAGVTADEIREDAAAVTLDPIDPPAMFATSVRREHWSAPESTSTPRPPWCGECDEGTRMRESGGELGPARCPECHPRSFAAAMAR